MVNQVTPQWHNVNRDGSAEAVRDDSSIDTVSSHEVPASPASAGSGQARAAGLQQEFFIGDRLEDRISRIDADLEQVNTRNSHLILENRGLLAASTNRFSKATLLGCLVASVAGTCFAKDFFQAPALRYENDLAYESGFSKLQQFCEKVNNENKDLSGRFSTLEQDHAQTRQLCEEVNNRNFHLSLEKTGLENDLSDCNLELDNIEVPKYSFPTKTIMGIFASAMVLARGIYNSRPVTRREVEVAKRDADMYARRLNIKNEENEALKIDVETARSEAREANAEKLTANTRAETAEAEKATAEEAKAIAEEAKVTAEAEKATANTRAETAEEAKATADAKVANYSANLLMSLVDPRKTVREGDASGLIKAGLWTAAGLAASSAAPVIATASIILGSAHVIATSPRFK